MSRIANVQPFVSGSSDQFQAGGVSTSELRPPPTKPGSASRTGKLESGTGEGIGSIHFEPTVNRIRGAEKLDPRLLEKSVQTLDGIERLPAEDMSLAIESLRYVVCELWLSAARASQSHRSVLAIVESLVSSVETVTSSQAAALCGAFNDLRQPVITEQHLDVIRSQFIDEGYNPMAILSGLESDPDGDGNEAGGS